MLKIEEEGGRWGEAGHARSGGELRGGRLNVPGSGGTKLVVVD